LGIKVVKNERAAIERLKESMRQKKKVKTNSNKTNTQAQKKH